MLFESEPILIKICQFFGLAPFSRQKTAKWQRHRFFEMISIVFCIAIVANILFCAIFKAVVLDQRGSRLMVVIGIYSVFLICAHALVILCENFRKRHHHVELLNLFVKLESFAKQRQGIDLDAKIMKRILHQSLLFWAWQPFVLLVFDVVLLLTSKNRYSIYFLIIYMLSFILSKLSYVYSMTLVRILNENVNGLIKFTASLSDGKTVKSNVNVFSVLSLNHRRTRQNEVSASTIDFLGKCYGMMWNASNLLNLIFHWSLPIGFFNEFCVLVFNSYFLIQMVRSGQEVHILLILSAWWVFTNIINILFITSTCGNTIQAVILKHFYFPKLKLNVF